MKKHVLITRPIEDIKETAQFIEGLGFSVFAEPLLTIEYRFQDLPDLKDYAGLIFTSANGVRALCDVDCPKDAKVYCVGDKTARTALDAGWKNVKSAAGDVNDLKTLLASETLGEEEKLLYCSAADIKEELSVPSIQIDRVCVYKAHRAGGLSPAFSEHLNEHGFFAAMFFSARTASIFADFLKKTGSEAAMNGTKALCISEAVVKSLSHLPWKDVHVAKSPDGKALAALLLDNQ